MPDLATSMFFQKKRGKLDEIIKQNLRDGINIVGVDGNTLERLKKEVAEEAKVTLKRSK